MKITTALLHFSVGVNVEHQIGYQPETSWNIKASCVQWGGGGSIEQGIQKLRDVSGCYVEIVSFRQRKFIQCRMAQTY